MRELELEFQRGGEVSDSGFKQLNISNRAYVYEISDAFNNRHYEMFERKEQLESETVMQEIKVHHISMVIYPKSNEYGKSA